MLNSAADCYVFMSSILNALLSLLYRAGKDLMLEMGMVTPLVPLL